MSLRGTGGKVNSSECVLRASPRTPGLCSQPWAQRPLHLEPSLASLLFPLQGPNSALNVSNHLIKSILPQVEQLAPISGSSNREPKGASEP